MRVHIGTSGYNYPEWRGTFYPEKFPAPKMFGYYSERFHTVEINYTFYRMPTEKLIAGWAAQATAIWRYVVRPIAVGGMLVGAGLATIAFAGRRA